MTVSVDIDQFTVVLSVKDTNELFKVYGWEKLCTRFITNITQQTQLESLYGVLEENLIKAPAGYNKVYSFPNVPFYLAFGFNSNQETGQGIIIKFSAHAWADYRKSYQEAFNESIHLHRFLQLIDSEFYTIRLSRVDVCCDFIDENINIETLKKSIEAGRVELRYGKYKNRTRKSHH